MITQADPAPLSTVPAQASRRMKGVWLWCARALWVGLFSLMLVLNGAAITTHLEYSTTGSGVSGLSVAATEAPGYRLRLDPLGPAAQAGVPEGDLLVAINGEPLQPGTSYREINRRLHGEIGDTLRLTVQGADGEVRQYSITLAEEPEAWRRFRLPLGQVGFYFPILETVLLAAYLLTAILIFWRRSDDWMALYLSATLALITPQLSYSWYFLSQSYEQWQMMLSLLVTVAVAFTLPNFYLLPDGRFVPRWTFVLTLIWVVWTLVTELFPTAPFSIYTWPGAAQLLVWLAWFATGMLAQAYRYRYVANAEERQQIKWLAFGLTLAVLVNLGWTLAFELFPVLNEPGSPNLLMWLVGRTVYVLGMMMLPISFGIAVFRYRLWDIDSLINRTLVYGALTTIVVSIYVVTVATLDTLFDTSGSMVSQIVAIALDLILFEPLRERLQSAADHLMFGDSKELMADGSTGHAATPVPADPASVVSRLGQRLTTAPGAEAELPALVETIGEALKLPYVAITLAGGGAGDDDVRESFDVAAVYGHPVSVCYTWPLVFQREVVGQLIFAPRVLGESFSAADWQLLEGLAHQAGLIAHHVLLVNELKKRSTQS